MNTHEDQVQGCNSMTDYLSHKSSNLFANGLANQFFHSGYL